MNSINEEVENAVSKGYVEITLLGQNVNSYRTLLGAFPELLQSIASISGVKRIRYTSPHPQDMDEKLLQVMSNNENICNYIHLPLQSGSDRILKRMNRTYNQKEFLDLIIREADSLMREKDLQQSSDALEYLINEISKTSLIDMKSSMNQLIQSQLETQMMAKISTDYALKVIEPPFIPERKFSPSRSLISLVGTMLGFVLGIVWVLIRHYYHRYTQKQTP